MASPLPIPSSPGDGDTSPPPLLPGFPQEGAAGPEDGPAPVDGVYRGDVVHDLVPFPNTEDGGMEKAQGAERGKGYGFRAGPAPVDGVYRGDVVHDLVPFPNTEDGGMEKAQGAERGKGYGFRAAEDLDLDLDLYTTALIEVEDAKHGDDHERTTYKFQGTEDLGKVTGAEEIEGTTLGQMEVLEGQGAEDAGKVAGAELVEGTTVGQVDDKVVQEEAYPEEVVQEEAHPEEVLQEEAHPEEMLQEEAHQEALAWIDDDDDMLQEEEEVAWIDEDDELQEEADQEEEEVAWIDEDDEVYPFFDDHDNNIMDADVLIKGLNGLHNITMSPEKYSASFYVLVSFQFGETNDLFHGIREAASKYSWCWIGNLERLTQAYDLRGSIGRLYYKLKQISKPLQEHQRKIQRHQTQIVAAICSLDYDLARADGWLHWDFLERNQNEVRQLASDMFQLKHRVDDVVAMPCATVHGHAQSILSRLDQIDSLGMFLRWFPNVDVRIDQIPVLRDNLVQLAKLLQGLHLDIGAFSSLAYFLPRLAFPNTDLQPQNIRQFANDTVVELHNLVNDVPTKSFATLNAHVQSLLKKLDDIDAQHVLYPDDVQRPEVLPPLFRFAPPPFPSPQHSS